MSDSESEIEDVAGTGTTIWGAIDLTQKILHGGKGLENGGIEGVSTILDAIGVGRGAYDLIEGASEGDGQHAVGGAGELLEGGMGIASTILGDSTAGTLLGAGAAGYGAGDFIAPYVFADVGQGAGDQMGADGTYHPSTGNETVDSVINFLTGD